MVVVVTEAAGTDCEVVVICDKARVPEIESVVCPFSARAFTPMVKSPKATTVLKKLLVVA